MPPLGFGLNIRQRFKSIRKKPNKPTTLPSDPSLAGGPSGNAFALNKASPSATTSSQQPHNVADQPNSSGSDHATPSQTRRLQQADVAASPEGSGQDSSVNDGTADPDAIHVASDLWSLAYREAVESLGKDLNAAVLNGNNVAQLFKQLGELDSDVTQDSAFLRGVKYLRELRVPLERFKMALDLSAPLTKATPLIGTACGIVQGVTAAVGSRKHAFWSAWS